MTVSYLPPERIGFQLYSFSWTSDIANATFYIYKDTELIQTTNQTNITIQFEDNESAVISVFDNSTDMPEQNLKSRMIIGWYDETETQHYLVQKLISSTWTTQQQIDDLGQNYFIYTSPFLPDCERVRYKIIPVGTNGNQGLGAYISEYIVRNPDVPNVSFVYNPADGRITVQNG